MWLGLGMVWAIGVRVTEGRDHPSLGINAAISRRRDGNPQADGDACDQGMAAENAATPLTTAANWVGANRRSAFRLAYVKLSVLMAGHQPMAGPSNSGAAHRIGVGEPLICVFVEHAAEGLRSGRRSKNVRDYSIGMCRMRRNGNETSRHAIAPDRLSRMRSESKK